MSLSTIAGGSVVNILRVFSENKIEKRYLPRAASSLLFALFAEPFRWWEHLKYDRVVSKMELKEPPVFILGHWRSGTTYLHNLMCEDPRMGYVTTYQGVFPELLGSEWIFKTFMQTAMPEKRPSDNVMLSPDFPQEEEFAMGNMNPYGFYNFWFFPKRTKEFYERYVEFKGVESSVISRWKSDYIRLVKKALLYTKRERFISKNPPHTGRIKLLLEMFPDARFIHIYRNPVTVFISTKKLAEATMPAIQFQDISNEEVEENILWIYERMMKGYLRDKKLISKENLVEICFEKFEKNTLRELERIYESLRLKGFDAAKPKMVHYIESQKSYEKNKYNIPRTVIEKITSRWKFAMEEWNYLLPDNVDVV
ncbi:MAG TPA: sulfotransferase [Chitinophagales bacterium]|nr:sulfotransferase [Chitinophagales bacterium]